MKECLCILWPRPLKYGVLHCLGKSVILWCYLLAPHANVYVVGILLHSCFRRSRFGLRSHHSLGGLKPTTSMGGRRRDHVGRLVLGSADRDSLWTVAAARGSGRGYGHGHLSPFIYVGFGGSPAVSDLAFHAQTLVVVVPTVLLCFCTGSLVTHA